MKFHKFHLLEWWETVIPNAKFKRKVPMTVCIAAICDNGIIFGASDRMMTSGDIEFEPKLDSVKKPQLPAPLNLQVNLNQKIYPLTNSIVVMTAGDSGLQCEVVQDALSIIHARVERDNLKWISVKETTDVYVEAYNRAKAKRAQQTIFAPFGLDLKTFIEKSNVMSPQLVGEITKQMQRFESFFANAHGIETIITGIDASIGGFPSAHIYSVVKSASGDFVTCNDSVGFAAVGSGARHAESQFMLAGHSPFSSTPETLLLTYAAKKRSEVAPGVGKGTDMFMVGANLGTFAMLQNIPDLDMGKIDSIYKEVDQKQGEAFLSGMNNTKEYIDGVINARAKQEQIITAPVPPEQPKK